MGNCCWYWGSGVISVGHEGSTGFYFGTTEAGGYGFGGFVTGGEGVGFNIGVGGFGSYFPGNISTLSGPNFNTNLIGGPISFTRMNDPLTDNNVGTSIGIGLGFPFGISMTSTNTVTAGVRCGDK